jgi:hypothetical protein
MNYVRTACSVPPNKPMNPTPLRGSLVAVLLGAGYRQPARRRSINTTILSTHCEFLETRRDTSRRTRETTDS